MLSDKAGSNLPQRRLGANYRMDEVELPVGAITRRLNSVGWPDRPEFLKAPKRPCEAGRLQGCCPGIPVFPYKGAKAFVIARSLLCCAPASREQTIANVFQATPPGQLDQCGFRIGDVIRILRHVSLCDPQKSRKVIDVRKQPRLDFSHGNAKEQIWVWRRRQPFAYEVCGTRRVVKICQDHKRLTFGGSIPAVDGAPQIAESTATIRHPT